MFALRDGLNCYVVRVCRVAVLQSGWDVVVFRLLLVFEHGIAVVSAVLAQFFALVHHVDDDCMNVAHKKKYIVYVGVHTN